MVALEHPHHPISLSTPKMRAGLPSFFQGYMCVRLRSNRIFMYMYSDDLYISHSPVCSPVTGVMFRLVLSRVWLKARAVHIKKESNLRGWNREKWKGNETLCVFPAARRKFFFFLETFPKSYTIEEGTQTFPDQTGSRVHKLSANLQTPFSTLLYDLLNQYVTFVQSCKN